MRVLGVEEEATVLLEAELMVVLWQVVVVGIEGASALGDGLEHGIDAAASDLALCARVVEDVLDVARGRQHEAVVAVLVVATNEHTVVADRVEVDLREELRTVRAVA